MNIHIIGIVGAMTAPLAVALKKSGHNVTGSDQIKTYPPFSTLLKKNNIPINTKKDFDNIDLAIVGSSYRSFLATTQEFNSVLEKNIPHISATEYISQNIVRDNSIIVAGTGGKTTITSLICWIFQKAKLTPSYMFGGQSLNHIASLEIAKGDWSIVEGDESINGLDTKAKFLYYPAKYVIITGANWEHKESYSDETKNFNAFRQLVEKIPKTGLLIANASGHKADQLSNFCKAKTISYNGPNAEYQIVKTKISDISKLFFKTPKGTIQIETTLIGRFNFENILAAVAICLEIGIDSKIIQKAVFSFKGVGRRLEKMCVKNNICFYDDFAQSPQRIKNALEAIKLHYPNQPIFVYLEPHATFLQKKLGLLGLKGALSGCQKIVLSKIPFSPKVPASDRATAKHYSEEIGDNLIYIPQNEDLYKYFSQNLKPKDILVHFSSGGTKGLKTLKKIINYYK